MSIPGKEFREMVDFYKENIKIIYGKKSSIENIIESLESKGKSRINFILSDGLNLILSNTQCHREMLAENEIRDEEILSFGEAHTTSGLISSVRLCINFRTFGALPQSKSDEEKEYLARQDGIEEHLIDYLVPKLKKCTEVAYEPGKSIRDEKLD